MVSVVLAQPHISAPAASVLSLPIMPSLFFSVQEAPPLPLARLVPLPLEGPLPRLLSSLLASVTAVAHHFVVQLEGPRASPASDVVLGAAEVVV